MIKTSIFLGAVLLLGATSAHAAGSNTAKPAEPSSFKAADSKFLLTTELTDYSSGFGRRRETTAEYSADFGRTAFTISASQARRRFESDSFKAFEVSGTLYRDWNDRLYTRTHVALASDKPVFASRQFANDFNLKLLPKTVVTVGGKYARYYGDRDVLTWSVGGTRYFGDAFVTYRYSNHDVARLGKSHSHLATFRMKDPRGSGQTQLWLGAGSSLHEQEVLLSGRKGSYRGVSLQRVQPIKGPLAVNLTVGRTWYDTSATDYRGTTASIGLNYSGWRIF
ncbi:MAG: YaiO family outer membrane beta-barrel protein [Pseudomonadota bacterium]|nr:YaiO family outer membrane beta-barrel protein [Pseudomonadota bacterium]